MTPVLGAAGRLARLRRLAWGLLLVERGWPAFWPALAAIEAFLCLALLGVPQSLPPALHIALLLAAVALFAGLAASGLRRLTLPNSTAADRRLEQDSALPHRPLAALLDGQAAGSGDPALWAAHLARAAGTIAQLRLRAPRPRLAARDRRAWRLVPLLGLCVGLAAAGPDAPTRLAAAVWPRFPASVPPAAPRLTAWITPPAFTGMPPVLLDMAHTDVSVPTGSRLTATVSAPSAPAPTLTLAGKATPFHLLAQDDRGSSWQAVRPLDVGGALDVQRGGASIGRWYVTAVADVPPSVQWPAEPGATAGRIPQLRLPWRVAHTYGVASLQVEIVLQQRLTAEPLRVPVPLPGAPKAARGVWAADLTAHPWAGLPVVATWSAQDTGGMTGRSTPRRFVMPERHFANPAAQLLISVRKLLALQPQDHGPPLAALAGLARDDATWRADSGGYLNLRDAMNRLVRAPTSGQAADAAIAAVQDRLWQLALQLEEGAPARTQKALAQARQALHDAVKAAGADRGSPPDPAARAEIARREQALRQALHDYMQALRRRAESDPSHPSPPEQQAMDAERALQQMQRTARSGTMQQTEQSLAELDQALDALQQTQREGQTQQDRQQEANRQRGRQQMGVVNDLVRREAGLLDRAQARAEPLDATRNLLDLPPGLQDPVETPPGNPPPSPAAGERRTDARMQSALRRALGVMMQQFGDLAGKVPKNLGDADQAMRDTVLALGAGDDGRAQTSAQRAVAALQQGGQAMRQQLAQQFGHDRSQNGPGQESGNDPKGQGEGEDGEGGRNAARPRTDPFGRSWQEGAAGSVDGGETAVPDAMEQARTRELQNELRRRGADRARPAPELDYIGRLLNPP